MLEGLKHVLKQSELQSSERVKLVAYFTDSCALIYHVIVFFVFLILGATPMAAFNILSISLFSTLIIKIKKAKSIVPLYLIASVEVILHQILADYFFGSFTCFHFFILLMGLLPYLIFRNRYVLAAILTILTSILFVALENVSMPGVYQLSSTVQKTLRILNISMTIFIIIFMIMIFTHAIFSFETNLQNSNQKLINEIKMASVIQQNFFKQDTSDLENCELDYYSKAMSGVSGDIYDFYKTNHHLDGLGIFDVSGHGISSGLITMLVKNIIHQEFYSHPDLHLWEIMNHINTRVIEEKGDIENYLTGVLARVDGNSIELCSAGHPMPIIYHKKTKTCELLVQNENSAGAIGLKDMPVFYYSQNVDFNKGDELILYSDGITEMTNSQKEAFGVERFMNLIQEVGESSVNNQIMAISHALKKFRGEKAQSDDITFIILKNLKNATRK